ncbi:MAG: SCO family protein [Polyangiaceae bacterium]
MTSFPAPLRRSVAVALSLGGIACVACAASPGAQTTAATPAAPATPPDSRSAAAPTQDWQKLVDEWKYTQPLPDFELVAHTGKPFKLSELGDGYVFVGFIFTHCQVRTACPLTMQKMKAVQSEWFRLEASGGTKGRKLRLLTLTIDPENDTPAALKEYGEIYRVDFKDWTFATGPEGLMREGLPSMLGIMVMPDGQGTISHGVKASLIAPGLAVIESWDDNAFEAEQVVAKVLEHGAG